MSTAVFTIVSRNYLHYARSLMESVAQVHPDWRRYVVLVDTPGPVAGSPAEGAFTLVPFDDLGLPEPRKFAFRYTILELNTAVKPWAFRWVLAHDAADRVVYLDPDIRLYGPLVEVERALDEGATMVLTPHLNAPLPADDRRPSEHHILKSGTYNLGFLALARQATTAEFLSWWQGKLEHDCRVDFAANLFVDQRWMDLAPALFAGVRVLRDDGYNVAYWNLGQRRIARDGGRLTSNGRPLAFFHFSGYRSSTPDVLSVHQDRHALAEFPVVAELARDYGARLIAHAEGPAPDYGFGTLADGSAIPDALRHCYRSTTAAQALAGDDPFAYHHAYANEPWPAPDRPLVTRLMRHVWESRPDLQEAFPEPGAASRAAFAHAFVNSVAPEMRLAERWVAPVRASIALGAPARGAPEGGVPGTAVWAAVNLLPMSFVEWCVRNKPEPLLAVWRLLGRDLRAKLRGPMYRWFHLRRSAAPPAIPPAGPGLNIVGYTRSEHGVGEVARSSAAVARAAGLPFVVHEFRDGNISRNEDLRLAAHEGPPRYSVNLIHVNADETPRVLASLGNALDGRANVGFWNWELPELPDAWAPAADRLDEVWVPSAFVQKAVSAKVKCPVVRMPPAIAFEVAPGARRADFGLPDDALVFVTQCDVLSVLERKNPAGAIEAYRRAFPAPGRARLVVKINNGQHAPAEVAGLASLAGGRPDIVLLDRILSREQMLQLLSVSDALVSLHRSEGFGLAIAEAMFLGKPVVVTGWSGNADFTTHANALIVDHVIRPLERDFGPYRKGARWAEPDLDHAARHLRELLETPQLAARVGADGQRTIREEYSPAALAARYRERVDWLCRLPGVSRGAGASAGGA